MDDNVCEVDINGTTYIIPCSNVKHLYYDGQYLVNVSDHVIILKESFENEYPMLKAEPMNVFKLYTTADESNVIRSNFDYSGDVFKVVDITYLIFIVLFFILGARLVWKN